MALTALTSHEKRQIRDSNPSLSDRIPGFDLSAFLDGIVAEANKILSGSATVLNGATTVVVAVGAAFDGKPVQVTFAEAPTAASIVSASVASGNLTITINADNTADLDVFYQIDGR